MSLFDKVLGTRNQEKGIATKPQGLIIPSKPLYIHPDLHGLLWVADGPQRNYTHKSSQTIFEINGVRFTVAFGFDKEPSLISIKEPISIINNISSVERPPYFPTYSQLTPLQRGVYWKLLENPYNTEIDVGFVFILYYGLERHLLEGDFEKAFQVVLKLRDVHPNKSFQSYSACALILTSIARKRADLAAFFLQSLDKDYELNFPSNMFLLCNYGLDIPLTCKDLMRLAKAFEFENLNYIKKYPELFESHLREIAIKELSSDLLDIKQYLTAVEWRKLKKQSFPMYANISIQEKTMDIPNIADCFKLKRVIFNLLDAAHNATKIELSTLRKEGIAPIVQTAETPKNKKPIVFDSKQEKLLLKEINKKRITEIHFAYIALQDFYYKYRDLNDEYLEKCIRFCEQDIDMLPSLQKEYRLEEEKRALLLASIHSKAEIKRQIDRIEPFMGNIPAFFRLAVIYEKKNDIKGALKVCTKAISYYKGIGMVDTANEFEERYTKLINKIEK